MKSSIWEDFGNSSRIPPQQTRDPVIRNHSRTAILTTHYRGICDLQSVASAAKTAFHCFFSFVKVCIQVSSHVKSLKYNIPSWTVPSLKMKALGCVAGPGFLYLETQRFILQTKSSVTLLPKYQSCFIYCIIHSTILHGWTVQQHRVHGRYRTATKMRSVLQVSPTFYSIASH